MIKNILISGRPGSGKTTLIKEILKELKLKAVGFYTQEIRENGKRIGFKIINLAGKEGILAHKDIKSPYSVSKYKVKIEDLEKIGVKAILEGLKGKNLIVIDEIGKMELFSEKFKKAVLKALNSKNKVLATIKLTSDPFSNKIKKRKDSQIFYLKKENFPEIKKEIKELIKRFIFIS
jgi:nucleoside-triphosphatase